MFITFVGNSIRLYTYFLRAISRKIGKTIKNEKEKKYVKEREKKKRKKKGRKQENGYSKI